MYCKCSYCIAIAILALLGLSRGHTASTSQLESTPANAGDGARKAKQPPSRLYPGLPNFGGDESGSCYGMVTAVGKRTIVAQAQEQKILQYNAKGEFVRTIVIPAQPPRTFTAIGPLAEGGYIKAGHPSDQYRLSDVRVGDMVGFDWRRVGEVYEIHYVRISRRPGGRVPPSPGEMPDAKIKYHERVQSLQDWEEKGTPIPDKYHPGGGQTGIAPPPHEAKVHSPG